MTSGIGKNPRGICGVSEHRDENTPQISLLANITHSTAITGTMGAGAVDKPLATVQHTRAAAFVLAISILLILEGTTRANLYIGTPSGMWTGESTTLDPGTMQTAVVAICLFSNAWRVAGVPHDNQDRGSDSCGLQPLCEFCRDDWRMRAGNHETFPPIVLLVAAVGVLFYGLLGLALGAS